MRRLHIDTGAQSLRFLMPASYQIPGSSIPSDFSGCFSDNILERWLAVDTLHAFCPLVLEEFRKVYRATRLLIVSWTDVRQCTWALQPGGDRITRLVESVFSFPGTRPSSLIAASLKHWSATNPDRVGDDPRLAEAGFDTYAVIETKSGIAYHVFWDDNVTPGTSHETLKLPHAGQLWRLLNAALTNMARLERLRDLSHIDFTTGIFNRRYFELRLTEEVSRARRFERPLSLAFLDIDDFKSLNDAYGHQAGDAVLHRVAESVRWTTRSIDVFCRLGGDEFTVLMPDADLSENPHLGDRLRSALVRRQPAIEGLPADFAITVSIGGAVFPMHCDDEARLIWCADMALLEAKHQGRDRFVLYEETMGRPGETNRR